VFTAQRVATPFRRQSLIVVGGIFSTTHLTLTQIRRPFHGTVAGTGSQTLLGREKVFKMHAAGVNFVSFLLHKFAMQ